MARTKRALGQTKTKVRQAGPDTAAPPVKNDPLIEGYIADLEKEYGKYRLPAEELRKRITAAMGDQSLSAMVIANRG